MISLVTSLAPAPKEMSRASLNRREMRISLMIPNPPNIWRQLAGTSFRKVAGQEFFHADLPGHIQACRLHANDMVGQLLDGFCFSQPVGQAVAEHLLADQGLCRKPPVPGSNNFLDRLLNTDIGKGQGHEWLMNRGTLCREFCYVDSFYGTDHL